MSDWITGHDCYTSAPIPSVRGLRFFPQTRRPPSRELFLHGKTLDGKPVSGVLSVTGWMTSTRFALGLDCCPEGREPEEMRGRGIDFADAKPGPCQILVQLKAAALNHRDIWIHSGGGVYADRKVPMTLGSDGAGEVVALGLAVLLLGH